MVSGIFRFSLGADYDGVGDGHILVFGGADSFANLVSAAAIVGPVVTSSPGIYFTNGDDNYTRGFGPGDAVLTRSNAGYLFDYSFLPYVALFVGGDRGDTLKGGSAFDNLRGEGGNDKIYGNAGADHLDGGAGNDLVDGGADNDTIEGRDGNDDLTGGAGDDEIGGGFGNDRLIGNAGRDASEGGSGRDNFIFVVASDSGATALTRDVIRDFTKGQDLITLSPVDANAGTVANEVFVFLGKGVSNTPLGTGRVRYHWEDYAGTENDKTIIRANTDADAAIEMSIELTGLITLNTSDFVL